MKNHAIPQYRDGVPLEGVVATATHADLIAISRYWRFYNLFLLTFLAAEWRLKNACKS